jgi:hypothetical protein
MLAVEKSKSKFYLASMNLNIISISDFFLTSLYSSTLTVKCGSENLNQSSPNIGASVKYWGVSLTKKLSQKPACNSRCPRSTCDIFTFDASEINFIKFYTLVNKLLLSRRSQLMKRATAKILPRYAT